MKTQWKYFVLLAFIVTPVLFQQCDDLISDFQDEDYSMNTTDQHGVDLLKDTVYVDRESAGMREWVYNYRNNVNVDTMLRNPTGMVNDSTYQFIYENSFNVLDTVQFNLTNGDNITLYYDSTLVISDTLQGSADSIQYTMTFPLRRSYPLDYYRVTLSTSERDTLPMTPISGILDSLEADSAFIHSDTSMINVKQATGESYYLCLNLDSYGKETVFYIPDFVRLAIQNEAGEIIEPLDTTVPPEISAGYFVVENEEVIPVVKTRYSYKLGSGRYLFQIDFTEQTMGATFHVAIVNK